MATGVDTTTADKIEEQKTNFLDEDPKVNKNSADEILTENQNSNAGGTTGEVTQKKESLEDLLTNLSKSIRGSDWLEQNTAEKWTAENPELAEEFKKVASGQGQS